MMQDVQPQTFSPLDRALVGGRRRSRRMRGGMMSLSPAEANSSYMIQDVQPQTFSPLDRALVGGRRRRHRKMMGGTGKQMPYLSPANVENRALMA
jgi:hypothetical protein